MDILVSSASTSRELTKERQAPMRMLLGRWAREPLVHFLLIGSLLFVVYAARDHSSQPGSKRIELTADDVRQLQMTFARAMGAPAHTQGAGGTRREPGSGRSTLS